jgi:hypothetical protein
MTWATESRLCRTESMSTKGTTKSGRARNFGATGDFANRGNRTTRHYCSSLKPGCFISGEIIRSASTSRCTSMRVPAWRALSTA